MEIRTKQEINTIYDLQDFTCIDELDKIPEHETQNYLDELEKYLNYCIFTQDELIKKVENFTKNYIENNNL